MTNDQIDDEALAARITDALHHRAAAVAVDDRLDSITDRLDVPGILGSGDPSPVLTLTRRKPAQGRRVAPRIVFAAAAALVAVALALAVWQRGTQEPLTPVSGPTPSDARIYPVVDPVTLEAVGLTPAPDAAITGSLSSTTGPALVLRNLTAGEATNVITVWVASPADAASGAVAVSPPNPLGPLPQGMVADPVTIGGRTVRQPYGDANAAPDLYVWLDPTATDADVEAVETILDDSLIVNSSSYLDHEATWADYQRAYANQPEALDPVGPDDLPTSFRVDLAVDDRDPAAVALESEMEGLSGVNVVAAAGEFERYEWDEAGATIVVDGPRGDGPTIEALIAGLTVVPQDGELPLVALDGVPEGWVVLAGPSGPTAQSIPVLNLTYSTGTASLNVTRQPSFVQHELTPVQVGGRAAYVSEWADQAFTLTWPLAEEGWWAQLVGDGLSRDQIVTLAEAVTFTDGAVWSARYPSSSPTTTATGPVTTVEGSAPATSVITGP